MFQKNWDQSINILEPNYCQSISNKEKNYLVLYLLDAVGSWQIILPIPNLENLTNLIKNPKRF